MTHFAARTDTGRRGGENEDATGENIARQWWFVADGMGGHGNGRVASGIVKQVMVTSDTPDLIEAIKTSHQQILAATAQNPSLGNMGSTIVAAEIAERRCKVAWVGDSRAYLFRDKQLKRLTRDHSYVEVLREVQGLSEEQIRGHPEGNIITQGLGMEEANPSIIEQPLRHKDIIVLCSDGLTDELTDAEMTAILCKASSVDDAADRLIAQALANGGKDNVSVVTVEYDGPSSSMQWWRNLDPTLVWPIVGGIGAATTVVMLWWWLTRTK